MTFAYLEPSTENILRTLHRKYRLGLISNFAIPECVDELLKTHGLIEFLDAVVVSAAVNKRKPSPEIFINALEKLRVSKDETVFVGDTLDADIDGAKSVGIKAIYIQRRIENADGHVKPDATIESLEELPSILREL